MPDLLGALIQLLQQLNEAKLGWLANTALIFITLLSLLFFTSYVLLSPRVVTLFKIIATVFKQSKPKLSEAFSSPYDIDLSENRIFIGFAAFFYYTYMIFFLLYV